MLRSTDGPTINKSIFADSIDEVNGSKSIDENKSMKSGTEFLTPKAKLNFGKLGQAFSTAPILYQFYSECHV